MSSKHLVILLAALAAAQNRGRGRATDTRALEGTWDVSEYFPASVVDGKASLACSAYTNVRMHITPRTWRRVAGDDQPDRFNSNGKWYILEVTRGEWMSYAKLRLRQDLITDVSPCLGFVREGDTLRVMMNSTDWEQCPMVDEEYSEICHRYNFWTMKCTDGNCLKPYVEQRTSGAAAAGLGLASLAALASWLV